jgi:general secretion pathway protein I
MMRSICKKLTLSKGFTLIEVLLALVIIAISLTALLRATSQSIVFTHRLKARAVAHYVAMNAVSAAQVHLPKIASTEAVMVLGYKFYCQVQFQETPVKSVRRMIVSVREKPGATPIEQLIAFQYSP